MAIVHFITKRIVEIRKTSGSRYLWRAGIVTREKNR